jgi:flagellin
MAAEVDRIANSTKFNNISMLNNTDVVTIRFGTASDDAITVTGADMTKSGLGIETGTGVTSLTSTGHVSDADAAGFFTFNDTAGTANGTLTLQFTDAGHPENDEAAVTVTFADTESLSLTELVDKINTASQNLGNDENGDSMNYAMASVYHNDTTGENYLKLSSREGGAVDDMTAVMTSTGTAAVTGTGGFATEGDLTAEMAAAVAETGINILDTTAAETALSAVTDAIGLKDVARSAFGYKINRLESTGEVLAIQAENLMAAESRISDVDVATEMAQLTRNQVLAQAGTAMLAQANSIPQMALTLLR